MGLQLQIVFVGASIITLFFVVLKIRKHKLSIDDSIIWILWSILLLVLSIFPQVAEFISNKMGFISTSNFILSLFIFFLYIILFFQMISISSLKDKNKQLIQKLSIEEYERKKEEEKNKKE